MKTTVGMDKHIAQLQTHCAVDTGTGIVRIFPVNQREKVTALVRGGTCRRMTRAEVLGTFKATFEELGEHAKKAVLV